jgi:hypothetical protein
LQLGAARGGTVGETGCLARALPCRWSSKPTTRQWTLRRPPSRATSPRGMLRFITQRSAQQESQSLRQNKVVLFYDDLFDYKSREEIDRDDRRR